jgi:hypothetical protein
MQTVQQFETIKIMLATHDSLTSYPIKTWWLRPFNFLCKCQNKTLEEQYAAGARSFDLRFAKYKGKWCGAHGAMIYDITIEEVFKKLSKLEGPVFFRVLCEDTVYRKSDIAELVNKVCEAQHAHLMPLYVRSKRTWKLAAEYSDNAQCADYPQCWKSKYTPSGMAKAVSNLYELQTSEGKYNFIACYSSKFIPCLTAKILTKIAKKKAWKENDVPVMDFI